MTQATVVIIVAVALGVLVLAYLFIEADRAVRAIGGTKWPVVKSRIARGYARKLLIAGVVVVSGLIVWLGMQALAVANSDRRFFAEVALGVFLFIYLVSLPIQWWLTLLYARMLTGVSPGGFRNPDANSSEPLSHE